MLFIALLDAMRSLTLSAVAPVFACLSASALVVRLRCVFSRCSNKAKDHNKPSQAAKQHSK